jgi:hypothetical protein
MTHGAATAARPRPCALSWSRARRLCACTAILFGAIPAMSAMAARSTSINDKSTLHRVKTIGNTLIEEGNAEGTLKGRVKLSLDLEEVRSATSHFVMYLQGGDLLGHATGKATIPKGYWESFGGNMWIDHGTGRYAHASGSGKMYGVLNRRTYVLIVQVTGRTRGL